MKILIKYPSRSRPEKFFEGLDSIMNNVADIDNLIVWATLDTDDTSMNNAEVIRKINQYPKVTAEWGLSKSKIDAVNRFVPMDIEWDILVLFSDDFRVTFWGFDQIIRQGFEDGDLDRLLHIPDQDAKAALATMYIAGRTFYERFGFIYDNRFKSLWCDNFVQDLAQYMGKYRFHNVTGVIVHLNPAYGHGERDEMFNRQQLDWDEDEATYRELKSLGFEDYLQNLKP